MFRTTILWLRPTYNVRRSAVDLDSFYFCIIYDASYILFDDACRRRNTILTLTHSHGWAAPRNEIGKRNTKNSRVAAPGHIGTDGDATTCQRWRLGYYEIEQITILTKRMLGLNPIRYLSYFSIMLNFNLNQIAEIRWYHLIFFFYF